TAKATIEVAGTIECEDFDWGTIVVKQGNEEFLLPNSLDGDIISDDFISISGSSSNEYSYGVINCNYTGDSWEFDGSHSGQPFELTNETGDKIHGVIADYYDFDELSADLTIPANVKAGNYTGSFTVSVTY
ncbi:MAG: DUF4402 domain-containing protein, partial [Alphaproteobacteria bacterium]|nr:DUF4402 domain-containing protein [Alphaproteobacteria bacterium]